MVRNRVAGFMLRLLLCAYALRAAGGRRDPLFVGNDDSRELAATRPIILLGLPLSGHHIIHDALMQANVRSSHNEMNRHAATLCNRWPVPEATVGDRVIGNKTWPQIPMMPECFVGISIQRAIAENRAPLDELLHLGYRAFSQLDSCHGSLCTFPQYEALTQIAAAYPDAYFVYTKKHTMDAHTNALVAHAEWDDLLRRYEKAGYLSQFSGQSKDKSARENAVIMLSAMQDRISSFFRGPVTGAGVGAGTGAGMRGVTGTGTGTATAKSGRSLKDTRESSGAKSPGAKGANPFGPSKVDFGSTADIAAAASASVSGTGGSAPAAHPTSSDTAREKKQQEYHQKEQLKEARKQQHKQKQAERAEEIERERVEEKERLKKESEAAKAIAANVTAAHKVDKQTKAEAKANATALYKAATSTNTKFNYLEIDVEDPGAAAALETFLGVRGLVLRLSREFVKDVASVAPATSKGQTMKAQSEGQGNKAVNATMVASLNKTSRATSTKMPSRTGTETAPGVAAKELKASGFSRDISEFPGPGSTPTANQPKELVVLVGLPKSGTSSVNDALRRLKVKTAHFEVNEFRTDKICTEWPIAETRVGGGSSGIPETFWGKANKPDGCYVGHVVQRALVRGKKPLADLIDHGYRAFTQIDLCRGDSCFFPQAEALYELTTAYPKALYVHTRRANLASHVASMDAWDGMLARFKKGGYLSKYAGQSANSSMAANGAIMVQELTRRTLEFFAKRPQLRFIDLSIEDDGSARKLAKFLGVPEQAFALDKTNTGHYDKKHSAAPTSARVSTQTTQSQRRARAESE